MTIRQQFTRAAAAVAVVTSLFSISATAEFPQGEFACQVIAQGGRAGLVLVQADTKERAEKAALEAAAFTTDNDRSSATRVIECIRYTEERFADYQFQKFFESVDM